MAPASATHGAIQGELARLPIEIVSPSNEIETDANIWAYTTIPSRSVPTPP